VQQTTVTPSFRIAHVSDIHLLESHSRAATRDRSGWSGAGYELQLRFVSFGRRLDAEDRRERLLRTLAIARRSGARHLVISGDLTELGTEAQFACFADALDEANVSPDEVTLVPGNHDAYTDGRAFARALAGPLAKYAASSATAPGKIVDRGEVAFLPIDATVHQPITRSGGELTNAAADALEERLADPSLRKKALVVVTHHPPYAEGTRVWQWIDALRGGTRLLQMLARFENVSVLHGHLHRAVTRLLDGGRNQVCGAAAVVDAEGAQPRVRTYDLRAGKLEASGLWAA
jgi:3',5'-cyclic AMP phosphodiesterase CpdA